MAATVPQARDDAREGVGHGPSSRTRDGLSEVGRLALVLCAGAALLLAVMTGLGLLLTHTLAHTAIIRGDERISHDLITHRSAGWTSETWWATQLAESFTVILLGIVAAIFLRFATRRWWPSIYVAAAVIGEASIYLLITLLVHRHRPPSASHLDSAPPTSSFPSGHVAATVALYGAIAVLAWALHRGVILRWILTVFAFVFPVAVAFSRVYRAMHFPTDVLAGALLGGCWLLVVTTVIRPSDRETGEVGHAKSRS